MVHTRADDNVYGNFSRLNTNLFWCLPFSFRAQANKQDVHSLNNLRHKKHYQIRLFTRGSGARVISQTQVSRAVHDTLIFISPRVRYYYLYFRSLLFLTALPTTNNPSHTQQARKNMISDLPKHNLSDSRCNISSSQIACVIRKES